MGAFETSDGVLLDYSETGDPNGRAVVLIAGLKAAATSWRYQVPALERAGYRVVAFDRRGHGRSEKPVHGATILRHGVDLHELLDRLDLRDVALVGGSMGASTIWAMVSQFGTDGISGIVSVDQTPKMLNSDDWPYGFYDYDVSNADTAFETGIPDPGRHPLLRKGPVRIRRLQKAMAGADRRFSTPELLLLQDHALADWRAVIAATDVPVLFVAGSDSEFWPSGHAPAAAALAPHGSAVVLPKNGHAAHIERPRAFTAVLREFLAGLENAVPG
ncbi:alpha/beta fold hydrolase [Pseudolysinimonas sp.]|uniref:alpha/beta fold hydrolase n=1 Tax=Pseudolysinimonas sp. TaxID=2680009 RepID=UPI003785019A